MQESVRKIDKEFREALKLLHSNEEDSAEKLRGMLDECIERKYGVERTLAFRMANGPLKKENTGRRPTTKTISATTEKDEISSLFLNDDTATAAYERETEVVELDFEDYSDKGEIPRISIPDEASMEEALCKICNGAKLGPLILLECYECQDAYHPLCHHPPIANVDVDDPRLIWRCGKCMETLNVPSTSAPLARAPSTSAPLSRMKSPKKRIGNKLARTLVVPKNVAGESRKRKVGSSSWRNARQSRSGGR